MARWRSLGLAVLLAAGGFNVLSSAPAPAAGPNRALVVVDTGATTYRQTITFTEDSVTGIRALELAGANPVLYSYAGQGGAVCRLFGVGRDAGPGCLGGADGDNRYWAYFRAPSGTSWFTYSRAGAGSVQVRNGDVEGWKFGTGQAPAWSAVPPPPTTTTVAPPPPPPPTAPTGGAAGGPTPPVNGGTAPVVGGPAPASGVTAVADPNALTSSTTMPSPTGADPKPSTAVGGKQASRGAPARVASGPLDPSNGGGSGGGAGSLAMFGVVAAALAGGVLYLRRTRRARST